MIIFFFISSKLHFTITPESRGYIDQNNFAM
jgi:hypothetical protein